MIILHRRSSQTRRRYTPSYAMGAWASTVLSKVRLFNANRFVLLLCVLSTACSTSCKLIRTQRKLHVKIGNPRRQRMTRRRGILLGHKQRQYQERATKRDWVLKGVRNELRSFKELLYMLKPLSFYIYIRFLMYFVTIGRITLFHISSISWVNVLVVILSHVDKQHTIWFSYSLDVKALFVVVTSLSSRLLFVMLLHPVLYQFLLISLTRD